MNMLPEKFNDKKIILFDGICNLCNKSIQFIIKKDKKDVFRFAALQSEVGQYFLNKFEIDRKRTDSMILIDSEENFYVKSSAALRIAKELPTISWMRLFLVLPKFFRDGVYNIIAKNRYRWFGKKDECMIPTPELKAKFLD